jgi:RHS repeat-associated protein
VQEKYGNRVTDIPYRFTGKELDSETNLYYYGARYLDPKTSRWISGDPALGDYLPSAPVNDEAKKRNSQLPGQGGVFNLVNLHVYHYAGNNPVKYVDPDGKKFDDFLSWTKNFSETIQKMMPLITGNATGNDLMNLTNWLRDGKITWDQLLVFSGMAIIYYVFYEPIMYIVNISSYIYKYLTHLTLSLGKYLSFFINSSIEDKKVTIGIETKPPKKTEIPELELPKPPSDVAPPPDDDKIPPDKTQDV